ncbi:hypothetical protein AYI69_g2959 [Smittium culicis]|uniref:Uncharacterized protein n=1 Tax=Smittium culicis TaxID=133412 RepID=A0A1R1YL23_9FUNG|nr:hypothetical protein AYI69_g2959 [Smittium culicis]
MERSLKKRLQDYHAFSLIQDLRAWIQDKFREVITKSISFDHTSRDESELVEKLNIFMELAPILARDARAGYIHKLHGFGIGYFSGNSYLILPMNPTSGDNTNGRKEFDEASLCAEVQEFG